jgi:hypothetical protein
MIAASGRKKPGDIAELPVDGDTGLCKARGAAVELNLTHGVEIHEGGLPPGVVASASRGPGGQQGESKTECALHDRIVLFVT